jgi:hypothetical protein
MSWVQLLSELDALGLREHALCPAEAEISELFSVLGCDVVETMAAIVQRCARVEVAEVEMDDNCGDQWIEEHDDFLLACEIQDRDEEESKERALRDLQFAQELAAQDREEENDAESLALAQQLAAQACEGHLMAAEDVKDDEKSVRAAAENAGACGKRRHVCGGRSPQTGHRLVLARRRGKGVDSTSGAAGAPVSAGIAVSGSSRRDFCRAGAGTLGPRGYGITPPRKSLPNRSNRQWWGLRKCRWLGRGAPAT